MSDNLYKKDFRIFENYKKTRGGELAYFDSAATSQKPKSVVDSEIFFYDNYNANINRGTYYLEEKSSDIYESTRQKVADFINAKDKSEIVFTKSATDSLNIIAQGFLNASILHSNLLQDFFDSSNQYCGCSGSDECSGNDEYSKGNECSGDCEHSSDNCSCSKDNSSCSEGDCHCSDKKCSCSEKASSSILEKRLDKINLDRYDLRKFSLFYKNRSENREKNSSHPADLLKNYSEQEITVTLAEHHSNLLPWRELSEKMGLKLNVLGIDEKGVVKTDKNSLENAITKKTKVVAVTYVSNVTGAITDLESIVKRAHEVGAMVVVDACQAAPHIKIDVQKLNVDFLAFSGHKMYGPTGVGVLYGRAELLNGLPAVQTGGSMVNMVDLDEGVLYDDSPSKFEAGTQMIAQIAGLGEAINYINEIGFGRMLDHEICLLKKLYEIEKIDSVKVLGPKYENVFDKKGDWKGNKIGLISFHVENIHPHDISQFLDAKNIAIRVGHQCAMPLHKQLGYTVSARVSLGVYNTEEDVDKFLCAMKDAIKFFDR